MRESYRDKQNRKSRIAREKMENFNNRNKKNHRKNNEKGYRKNYREIYKESKSAENRDSETNIEKEYEDVVAGRNAVLELLKSGKDINKLFIEKGEKRGSINEIIAKAKENKVVIVETDKNKLDQIAENNQGVIAIVPPFNYCEVDDILNYAKQKKEDPFILILDGIEDVHNLGAIIRTAETAGVHGIIIPKRRAAQVNNTVVKVSSGATSYVKIARVNNLNETIKFLKEQGLWIVGTDGEAKEEYFNQDLTGSIAIIIGSEGFGMSDLVKKNVDFLVKIPMFRKNYIIKCISF